MTQQPWTLETKRLPPGAVLIVGAGLAGLYMALKLAPRPVFVLTSRRSAKGSASAWAQGGIAVALDPDDSARSHADDTIAAGDGLVDPDIAMLLASEGPARVKDLMQLGVPFDQTADGSLNYGLEAAHSRARVAKVKGDGAGRAIIDVMVKRSQEAEHITGLIGWRAESLLSDGQGGVAGALARNDEGKLLALKRTSPCLPRAVLAACLRSRRTRVLPAAIALAWPRVWGHFCAILSLCSSIPQLLI